MIIMDEINIARLTEEINEFNKYLEPTKFEIDCRERVFANIQKHIIRHFPGVNAVLLGSCRTKLLLPTSNVNIAITYPTNEDVSKRQILDSVMDMICNNTTSLKLDIIGFAYESVVPKIQCIDVHTQVRVEITVRTYPCHSTRTIEWMEEYPDLKPLFLVIKHSLMGIVLTDSPRYKKVMKPNTGGLPSYAIICLIVHYLKYNQEARSFVNPVTRLGNLLLGFLKYYATFPFKTKGLTFHNADGFFGVTGSAFQFATSTMKFRMTIQNPDQLGQNVTLNCRLAIQFKGVLTWMYGRLQSRVVSNKFQRSMLSCIIAVEPHEPGEPRKLLSEYKLPTILLSSEDINEHCLPGQPHVSFEELNKRKRQKLPNVVNQKAAKGGKKRSRHRSKQRWP